MPLEFWPLQGGIGKAADDLKAAVFRPIGILISHALEEKVALARFVADLGTPARRGRLGA
jgi:hypothetical protein